MLHWSAKSAKCPYYTQNGKYVVFVTNSTCIYCLKYGLEIVEGEQLKKEIRKAIKQLEYNKDFDAIVNSDD